MAAPSLPSGGVTLHGVGDRVEEGKANSASAVLLKVSDGMLQDIRKAAQARDGLQFVTGSTPKLRIGGRTIDLTLSCEAFRNELYASTSAGSLSDLTFSGVVSHRAELKHDKKNTDEDTAGSDAALAALQNSLASYEQEKQAKQSTIVSSVLPTKGRLGQQKRSLLNPNHTSHPSLSASATPRSGAALPTASNSEAAVRLQALKTPLIHLLALKPASNESITSTTHIPKEDLDNILQKIAKQQYGKWHLGDRAYKDLDVWNFAYTSKDDRQLVIDNAIRAYDRLRVDKEDKIWQQLLPKKDRGKGTILSRLNTSAGQVNRSLTPSYAPSPLPHPLPHTDGAIEGKPTSTANTPRLGASTPRPTNAKGDIMKRLLSKNPQKARAAEDAKEKKRKERESTRETAASDREGAKPAKRQATKKEKPKIKSEEIIHSSDDESGEEGEVKEEITRIDSKTALEKPKPAERPKKTTSASPEHSKDVPAKAKAQSARPTAKPKAPVDPAKSIASLASKAVTPMGAGRNTPRTTGGLSAPASQRKSQRSPQKPDSRPNVPSPLGAARPRVASDVSDRSAIGVQRTKQGAGTPQGLGVTNGLRKRQDTVTSTESAISSSSDKKRPEDLSSQKMQKPIANGTSTPKAPLTNGAVQKAGQGVKRKAESSQSQVREDAPAVKHRKTESTSSQSQKSQASSAATARSSARTSPDSGSSDSAASVLDAITFTQGVNLAEKFRDVYYPAYTKMYDAQAAKEAKGEKISKDERDRLWAMHRRLEQMKREIQIAAEREHGED